MKKSITLFVVAGCLALPALTHADTPAPKKAPDRRPVPASAVPRPDPNRMIYYISTVPATGSHIPQVRRAYHGRIDSASSPAVYGLTQIQTTGQLDVGAILTRLDPSIGLR